MGTERGVVKRMCWTEKWKTELVVKSGANVHWGRGVCRCPSVWGICKEEGSEVREEGAERVSEENKGGSG